MAKIDYTNYKIFFWTEKQIKKQFSEEIYNKFGKIISYLFQNGFRVNCEEDEIEEQLRDFNYFKAEEDFLELKNLTPNITSTFEIGKKIVVEEIYDIIKENTFFRKDSENPILVKSYAETHWNDIIKATNRISDLFYSQDLEIIGVLSSIKNLGDIRERVNFIEEKIEKGIKVLTWLKFSSLMNILYSLYIQLGKTKTDQHKLTIASNLNDELYGGIGGYNPLNGEIKCIIGSAVYDVKSCKAGNKSKIKNVASAIFKETKTEEDEEPIKFLERWLKGSEKDDSYAQRIVVNSLLHGILTLLTLKHNINFLEDDRNSRRAENVKNEFKAIMKYCNVDKEYLL